NLFRLIQALDLDNVALVGHSMGGPASLRAAALSGDRVRGVVAVDTLHDAGIDSNLKYADFDAGPMEELPRGFLRSSVAPGLQPPSRRRPVTPATRHGLGPAEPRHSHAMNQI